MNTERAALVTASELTDEQIREEWDASNVLMRAECYYALKRNARQRAGLQGDDEFSLFCEESAVAVASAINARRSGPAVPQRRRLKTVPGGVPVPADDGGGPRLWGWMGVGPGEEP